MHEGCSLFDEQIKVVAAQDCQVGLKCLLVEQVLVHQVARDELALLLSDNKFLNLNPDADWSALTAHQLI
jgi:hypothetical protein